MFSQRAIVFAVVFLGLGGAVGALAMRGEPPRRLKFAVDVPASARVAPTDLASWIIEGRRDFTVIDLRDTPSYEAGHVQDAVHCGSCHEDKGQGRHAVEDHFVDLSKKLVLYTATGREAIELPRLLARNPRLAVLEGGYAAWQAQVLAPVALDGEPGSEALDAARRREAVRAFFAGERAGTARPAQLPVTPIRREGAHQPAAAHEGC